ncbi:MULTISPECIES: glycosyltransferase family 1 protein [unclassified Mesorhizobium]|uniref:glycosyltransferase family 1 protein n=1 Tax=unclassified Mesorhizobium TaxID=325217 RepID=UPI000FC9A732|nr:MULTISPECIES: glycosyltransferase family 1 protein [unclassified Mesorhizobium]RUX02500.1 glycosyltransferase family 1 protein [Mesorhizobium sp. M8A.F.Ca.ET.059.01.1.1]RUW53363.1 glycosyltransferase family 1 protein [Mesorhizobium sp. M8A.F.Ca.ET.021.01.1.1]TGP95503.1 glycosyltransferase family 1 protein [Mesorhizobium sp. M8A.F.Ca.ET.218.01.1.1]TGT18558.1 glycosyltransferase family 1 protein [Mesorhizobium sp. M8A.F.Ca.ET.213.01.1.1]TGT89569.1 glycosyltransferase family 1 protein [Mesorhi
MKNRAVAKDHVTSSDSSLLLCFSHLRWNFVYQRPQHILTLASKSQKVVYFEEPIFESVAKASMRADLISPSITVVTPILPLGTDPADATKIQRNFVDQLIAATPQHLLTLWYYTPMALQFSDHVLCDVCVYDCMDELSAFKNAPPELIQMERKLLERADIVFTGGQSLYEAKRGLHRSIFPFPSSIDFTHFHQARATGEDPHDQIQIPHPRVGYFGVIDERLDVGLVAQGARGMPDIHFVMLGPVVKIDRDSLPRAANIHWLGGKDYADLPNYLRHWDAGWMPFALNAATRYISPTKTPEFLAAGVPLVSTAIVDVVRTYGAKGLVEIIDASDAEVKIRSVLARPRDSWLSRVDAYLVDMSWEKTWVAMAGHLEHAHSRKNVVAFRRSA